MSTILTRDVSSTPSTGAGEVWTSAWYDVSGFATVTLATASDVPGSYRFEFSVNKVDVDSTPSYVYQPGVSFQPHRLSVGRRYLRIVYTTGPDPRGFHRLQVVGGIGSQPALTSALDSVVEPQADSLVTRVIDTETMLADGLLYGRYIVNKFGENGDVDGEEDIWGGGGLYTGQPVGAAETLEVFSASTDDAAGGTGARTLYIEGLDANGLFQSAEVTLNGTTPVLIPGLLWTRMNRGKVLTAGSGGKNAGILTVRHTSTTANVFARIPAGANQTHIGAYTVPSDKRGRVVALYASLVRESGGPLEREARMALMVRDPGAVYRQTFPANISNADKLDRVLYGGIRLEPGADVVWRCLSVTSVNTIISAGFDLILSPA